MNTAPPSGECAARVLYADDDCIFRDLVKRALERLGRHEVCAIDDNANTLKQAAELQPDVIVLDARLSQRSGLDVLRQLRAPPETAATPALFCAEFVESELREAVRDLNVAAVISKLDLRQLVAKVQRALNAAKCEAPAFVSGFSEATYPRQALYATFTACRGAFI